MQGLLDHLAEELAREYVALMKGGDDADETKATDDVTANKDE